MNVKELKKVGLLKVNEIFFREKYKKIGAKMKKRKYCFKKEEKKLQYPYAIEFRVLKIPKL